VISCPGQGASITANTSATILNSALSEGER
jgi:hypothetical protein